MKKIGIHGSYYCRNFGDTLILYVVKKWIKEYSNDIEIFLPFVNSNEEAFEILNTDNIDVKIGDLDGLIFGPGGYFGEPPGNFLQKLRWSLRNYKRHILWNNQLYKNNIPYGIVGVGVGPLSFMFIRKGVIKLFRNAEFISVRDKYSKKYLIDWGIEENRINISPDVALTLKKEGTEIKNNKQKVGVHYPNLNLVNSGKDIEFINFIKEIQTNNEVFLIEDGAGQYDHKIKNSLKELLSKKGIDLPIIKYVNPENLINQIEGLDIIITSKLHVGIVSYSLGKKIISIPSHTKTTRFYEQIDRAKFCIPLKEINSNLLINRFKDLESISNEKNILFKDSLVNKKSLFNFLDNVYKN